MTTSVVVVDGAQLTAAAATYGSVVGANTKRIIKAATLTNTTAGAVACTVYLVPSGGTAGASNTVISALSIAAGASYSCPELIGRGLNAGGFLQALGLNVTLGYTAVDVV